MLHFNFNTMQKKVLILLVCLLAVIQSFASYPKGKIKWRLTDEYTIVELIVEKGNSFCAFGVSSSNREAFYLTDTYITVRFKGKDCPLYKLVAMDGGKINSTYKGDSELHFTLYFPRLPGGTTTFGLHLAFEYTNGWMSGYAYDWWNWKSLEVTNPYPQTPHLNMSESDIKSSIMANNDGICGIYEQVKSSSNSGYTLACIKHEGVYKLLYMDASDKSLPIEGSWPWEFGDVKAILRESASSGLFKGTWYMVRKVTNDNCYISFTGSSMKTIIDGNENLYIKMFPSTSQSGGTLENSGEWSGTGFALNNGYIVTNHHVVNGAKSITVLGVNGNADVEYKARVVGVDKNNDLALIMIDDYRFNGFGNVPYAVPNVTRDVGSDVFVLGYPLTTYMGDEIKLTNGIISSKTGYQGDVSTYQISAPVQPGNSGGPLFDNKGNVIGIVNAGIPGAENVGYAVKTSYLYNLVESVASTSIIPENNTIAGSSLAEKVKQVKDFVFFIKCKGN